MNKKDLVELIKDAALFGGSVPNDKIEEVRAFLDEADVTSKEKIQQKLVEISAEIFCEDGKLVGKSPDQMAKWIIEDNKGPEVTIPEGTDERMNIIGQNGNTGEHYAECDIPHDDPNLPWNLKH